MWSNLLLCRFQQPGKVPQTQASQGFAAFFPVPSRIPPRHTQIKRATNCAIPGYLILNHYSTKFVRLKVFSVCSHLCGQSRFCAVFGNRKKSRKRRCRKALRRFTSPYPGYSHGTPKCGALPTGLHPDIHFSAMIPRRCGGRKPAPHMAKNHERYLNNTHLSYHGAAEKATARRRFSAPRCDLPISSA